MFYGDFQCGEDDEPEEEDSNQQISQDGSQFSDDPGIDNIEEEGESEGKDPEYNQADVEVTNKNVNN